MKKKSRFVIAMIFLGVLLGVNQPTSAQPVYPGNTSLQQKVWLGVIARDLSFDKLASLNLDQGVSVAHVAVGSPAEAAGLREGDIIVKFHEKPVYSVRRLQWLVSRAPIDESVSLEYYRAGEVRTLDIQLRSPHVPSAGFHYWQRWHWPSRTYLGVQLQPMTDDLRKYFGAPEGIGVLVAEVSQDSPAERTGLAAGDVIKKMDRKVIHQIPDVYKVLDFFDPGDEIAVEIIRGGESKTITVVLAEPPDPISTGQPYQGWWNLPREIPGTMLDPRYWQEELEEVLDRWKRLWQDMREHYFEEGTDGLSV